MVTVTDDVTNQLYGRTAEGLRLQECFSDAILSSSSRPHLMRLEGPSGIGKRALALTLQTHVQEMGGLFLTGRFQERRSSNEKTNHASSAESFGVFREALRGLMDLKDKRTLLPLRKSIAAQFSTPEDEKALMELLGPTTSRMLLSEYVSAPQSNYLKSYLPHYLQSKTSPEDRCGVLTRLIQTVSKSLPLVLLFERVDFADTLAIEAIQSLCNLQADDAYPTKTGMLIVTTRQDEPGSSEKIRTIQRASENHSSESPPLTDTNTDDATQMTIAGNGEVRLICLSQLSRDDIFTWTLDHVEHMEYVNDEILALVDVLYKKPWEILGLCAGS